MRVKPLTRCSSFLLVCACIHCAGADTDAVFKYKTTELESGAASTAQGHAQSAWRVSNSTYNGNTEYLSSRSRVKRRSKSGTVAEFTLWSSSGISSIVSPEKVLANNAHHRSMSANSLSLQIDADEKNHEAATNSTSINSRDTQPSAETAKIEREHQRLRASMCNTGYFYNLDSQTCQIVQPGYYLPTTITSSTDYKAFIISTENYPLITGIYYQTSEYSNGYPIYKKQKYGKYWCWYSDSDWVCGPSSNVGTTTGTVKWVPSEGKAYVYTSLSWVNAGISWSLSTQMPCETGSFSSTSGATTCTSCNPGTYQVYFASTSCLNANAGTYCPVSGDDGADEVTISGSSCNPDYNGVFQFVDFADNGFGYFAKTDKSLYCAYYHTTSTLSLRCGPNLADLVTNKDYYIKKDLIGGSGAKEWCVTDYSATDVVVKNDYNCFSCQPGKYSPARASACSVCSAGTYSDSSFATACTACPSGTTSLEGAAKCLTTITPSLSGPSPSPSTSSSSSSSGGTTPSWLLPVIIVGSVVFGCGICAACWRCGCLKGCCEKKNKAKDSKDANRCGKDEDIEDGVAGGQAITNPAELNDMHKITDAKSDIVTVIDAKEPKDGPSPPLPEALISEAERMLITKIAKEAEYDESRQTRFFEKEYKLKTGHPVEASKGLNARLGYDTMESGQILAKGLDSIKEEVAKLAADSGDVDAREVGELLNYILHQKTSEKTYPNGIRDKGRRGLKIEDFYAHESARTAGLVMEELVAMRLYTTVAFKFMNTPLRDDARVERGDPCPLPASTLFAQSGLKKLRVVNYNPAPNSPTANRNSQAPTVLWRGMRNITVTDDFLTNGGTELAFMSTTKDLEVAIKYSLSPRSLLFKIVPENFMATGADVAWFSAFPGEAEVLYPPLTYLQPTGRTENIKVKTESREYSFTIVEVKPTLS